MTDMSWIDQVDQVDQSTLDVGAPTYPYIQWVNGKPDRMELGGVKYTGGWFCPEDQMQTDTPDPDWTHGVLTHANGDSTDGWFAKTVTCAIIRWRQAWQVMINGASRRYPWRDYDIAQAAGHPMGKLQVLVMFPGDEPPTVLTLSGTAARSFAPSRQGVSVMNDLYRYVITPANKLARSKGKLAAFPWRAFWVTVGAQTDPKGKPLFATVGKGTATSQVTPPAALGLHDKMEPAEVAKCFVGAENLKAYNEVYADSAAWASAWDAAAAPAQQATVSEQELEEIPY
jgi:hypothetical protein